MIGPNNREARQWERVRMDAVLRRLEQARMEAVRQILEARKPKEQRPVQADMLTERSA